MSKRYIKFSAALSAVILSLSLAACSYNNISTDSVSNKGDSSVISAENSSVSDSSSDSSSDTNSSTASSTVESTVKYEPVKDGKFSLPNGKLSFAMPEGWKLASMAIAYQFADEDEYNDNKFNLVVSKTDSPIEEVTSEQMTATYSATMENFKLVAFEHTEIAGKSAVYMQLTGMVSQVTRQTTITQYMIQSGEDAYCFSFTQSTDDGVFPDLIAGVIDSLEIQ
ncbi:MAG: hypothetical protein KIG32_09550 [Ruminiclostridium sp.]|nr:hypothetical protein [Ruminiclostridium sp.]